MKRDGLLCRCQTEWELTPEAEGLDLEIMEGVGIKETKGIYTEIFLGPSPPFTMHLSQKAVFSWLHQLSQSSIQWNESWNS